jgi:hypothetical protein
VQYPEKYTPIVPLETNPRFNKDWFSKNSGGNVIFGCNYLTGKSEYSQNAYEINSSVYADWAKDTKTFSQLAKLPKQPPKLKEFINIHANDDKFIDEFDALGKIDIMIFTANEDKIEYSADKSSVICGIRGNACASLIACSTKEGADYVKYYIQKQGYGSCLAVCTFNDIKTLSKIDDVNIRKALLNQLAQTFEHNIRIDDID